MRLHGLSDTRLYRAWYNMRIRCTYPAAKCYARYGGRGISVCDEWMNDSAAFILWALANGYDDTKEIDRKDPDGDYCPENCRWVSRKAQANNKRNTRWLTWNGETKSVHEWAEELGVSIGALQLRVTRKWPIERIFTQAYR